MPKVRGFPHAAASLGLLPHVIRHALDGWLLSSRDDGRVPSVPSAASQSQVLSDCIYGVELTTCFNFPSLSDVFRTSARSFL
jgi:hypothetical protein